jgi:subtilisin family serine protease
VTNVAWLLRPVRLRPVRLRAVLPIRAVRPIRAVLPILAAIAVATAATALPAYAALPAHAAPRAAATRAAEWWLTALNAPAAWRAAPAEGKGVTVAVLSTGVDGRHPDLAGSVTTGPDLSQTGRKPGDQYWGAEGTAVASLIAGHGHGHGQAAGVTGIAPGARILSIQVTLEYNDPLNSDAAISKRLPAAIAAGIRYAVSHGATVIALPLDPGTLGPTTSGDPAAAGGSQAERSAVSYAIAHNVLLVAPAGDNGAGTRTVNYPAAYPGVIAVGATARNGQLSPFTNIGSYVGLTSPGSGETPLTPGADLTLTDPAAGLLVAAPDGGYQSLASTDMSSALTAGVAALIRGRYGWLTVAEVTAALASGATVPRADRSGTGKTATAKPGWGHGELDAATALTAAGAIAAAHPAPKPTPTPKASPAVAPAGPGTAKPAASAKPDPGAGVRSILLDLVVVAAALIAALIGALTIARLRRRSRSADRGRSSRAARSSHAARHARALGPPPPPPGSFTQPRGSVEVFRAIAPVPRSPRAIEAPPARRPLAIEAPADPSRAQRPRRATGDRATGDRPPWAPARKPNESPAPGRLDPQPANAQLAPWEQSPPDFDALPPAPETPPRPVSTTGPMYIWNPAEPPPV